MLSPTDYDNSQSDHIAMVCSRQ